MKIQDGTFKPGSVFYSCAELCQRYGLPPAQARRIQHALVARRLLLQSNGGRFLVLPSGYAAVTTPNPIRGVRIIGDVSAICDGSYGGRIVAGLRSACDERGLAFQREFVHVLNNPPNYLNTHRTMPSDEGLVVMMHQYMVQETIQLLLNHDISVVTVNSYFTLRTAVLPDYNLAMKELLENAASRGARRVMFCYGYGLFPCPIIADERASAFREHTARMGLEALADPSGNYHQVAKAVVQFKPDAILYQNDIHALAFRTYYLPQCGLATRVMGCDNHVEGTDLSLDTLTTWDTRPEEMGRLCVEALFHPCVVSKPFVARVKGHLVVRD